MPTSASPAPFKAGWEQVQAAIEVNRAVEQIETATLATIDVNRVGHAAANDLRRYMESYYSLPYDQLGERLGCCSGTGTARAEWLDGFRRAGVRHLIVRFDADGQFA